MRLTEAATGGVLTLMAEPGAALFLQHETRRSANGSTPIWAVRPSTKLRFVQGRLPHARKLPRPSPAASARRAADDPAHQFQGPKGFGTRCC